MYIPTRKTDEMPNGRWLTEAFYIELKLKKYFIHYSLFLEI